MAYASEPRLLTLHGLRLKGFAQPPAVADLVGRPEDEVTALLVELEAAGLVQHRDGRLVGYALTAVGREEHERMLAAELDDAGAREAVVHGYKRFLEPSWTTPARARRWCTATSGSSS